MFNIFKKKKCNVLILGNNGMLGHELYETFMKLSSDKYSNIGTVIGIDVKDGVDLTKRHALGNFMMNCIHFDYCINCVAHTDTKSAETTKEGKELDYKLNALAPKYIAESCKHWKTKLIHISTDYVFSENSIDAAWNPNNTPVPFKPGDEPFPTNNYGVHKLLGEKFIEEAFGKDSKKYAILRVSWLYGAWNNKSFVHKFLKNVALKLKTDPDAQITMTSNEMSVPTSVDYVVSCIRDVIDNNKSGLFHAVPLYNHSGVSRFEFAQEMLNFFKDEPEDYTLNGKSLRDITLVPIEFDGYYPKYSAMKNTRKDKQHITAVGPTRNWEDDLFKFMENNKEHLFKLMNEV